MIQSIKKITLDKNVDLELFNEIKRFALKKRDYGEVKIYFPKEEYFNDDFDLVSPDENIVLSVYCEDEYSYKRLVARIMDGFEELDVNYDWKAVYIPVISIIFDESIDSDVFYNIINKNRNGLETCKIWSKMCDLISKDLISMNFSIICQMNDFDRLLDEILSEIKEVNPDFEIIVM